MNVETTLAAQLKPSRADLPYHPISRHYKKTFGEKVYKIPVTTATTCPNREGLKGMKTCNFCDVWGSAAYPDIQSQGLRDQIIKSRERVLSRVNAGAFLVYFQAYTTTFSKVAELREHMKVAASFDDVKGMVIGTRPDCISDALFDLINEMSQTHYIAIELGVQTFDEKQLLWMRRGHTAAQSLKAIQRIKTNCPKANLGIHLMFGLPGEGENQIRETAAICNSLPIDNVKLHNLHVLINTPLAEDYARGEFIPLTRDEYSERVMIFLQHLRNDIAVHRLSALASRSEELVAPAWTGKKMETYQSIIDYMNERSAYQGQHA